jgi:hypothetical protein
MRNDYAKALHGALMAGLGFDTAREFWRRRPLERGGNPLSERELASHVWDENARSPVAWLVGLVVALEPFLAEHGVDLPDFAARTRRHANRGSWIRTRHLLGWLSPLLVPMFRFGDPYRLLLHGARLVSSKMSPGVDVRLARWRSDGNDDPLQKTGSIFTTYPGLAEGHIPAWDYAQQPGLDMVAAPTIFDLPPFASIRPILDARAAETVPWRVRCSRNNDRFLIEGQTFGRVQSLHEFLAGAGYEPCELGVANGRVVAVDRDYVCPDRKRAVLAQGCAYGAPGYLVRLTWSPARPPLRNFLSPAHAELEQEGLVEAELEGLQRRYLELVSETLHVAYHPADGSIAINGRHLCRGVQARILYECVAIANREGRLEFSYREFKRLPELVSHPKNTGFETRLKRLRAVLEAAQTGLGIAPRGRGRFALTTTGRLELH